MNERDGLDLLDLRLLGYLRERAEAAAAYGPGPEAVAASIADAAPPAGRSLGVVVRLPAMAWIALAVVALALVALAASLAGSERHDRSLFVEQSSTGPHPAPSGGKPDLLAETLMGGWLLDFQASGIDDAYGGSPRPDGLTFATALMFGIPGHLEVSSGAGGGCRVPGTWTSTDDQIAIDISTAVDPCEAGGPGPEAREIRRRLARARTYSLAGDRLELLDGAGALLLSFRGPPMVWLPGRLELDFEASGIAGYYTVAVRNNERLPVTSWIEFQGSTLIGGTGADVGCDEFTGIVSRDGQGLSISIPIAPGHCKPESPDLEVRRRLARTATFAIVGDTFRLYDSEGTELLVYRNEESATPAP